MRWNYTKTVALLVIAGLTVKLVIQASSGANLYGGPGAVVPLGIGVALVTLPVAVLADFIAWRRSRGDDYRE